MSDRPRRRIAIVGAGITGLAAARRLLEPGSGSGDRPEVVLFEAAARPGGIVSTLRKDGFLLEEGPDSFLTEKPEALAICHRLGLADSLLPVRAAARRSYIVRCGRLVRTPETFQLLAPARLAPTMRSPLLSPLAKLRLALEPFVPPRGRGRPEGLVDESVGSFVARRMGREVLERIAQPMIGGIYGADPDSLSLLATFPRFLRMEAEHGSVIRGLRAAAGPAPDAASGPRYSLFATLCEGMQALTDALAAGLPEGVLRLASAIRRLAPDARNARDIRWHLETGSHDGSAEPFDAVILAVPAAIAARTIESFDRELAEGLSAGRSGSSVNVALGYETADVRHPMEGAGFVVPAVERLTILGGSFVHRKFEHRAPAGKALLRIFLDARALPLDDGAVIALVRREIAPLLGIERAPLFAHVARWPDGMPHYLVGHVDRVTELRRRAARWPGLELAGSSYDGVGLPDCIRSGERAAAALLLRDGSGARGH